MLVKQPRAHSLSWTCLPHNVEDTKTVGEDEMRSSWMKAFGWPYIFLCNVKYLEWKSTNLFCVFKSVATLDTNKSVVSDGKDHYLVIKSQWNSQHVCWGQLELNCTVRLKRDSWCNMSKMNGMGGGRMWGVQKPSPLLYLQWNQLVMDIFWLAPCVLSFGLCILKYIPLSALPCAYRFCPH